MHTFYRPGFTPMYAAGFDDCMAGRCGRRTFDVSVRLFVDKDEAEAYVSGKVIGLHTYYVSPESIGGIIAKHDAERELYVRRLS